MEIKQQTLVEILAIIELQKQYLEALLILNPIHQTPFYQPYAYLGSNKLCYL